MRDTTTPEAPVGSGATVTLIIVNYNTRELVLDCLRSLDRDRQKLKLDVVVVDSASNDGSAGAIKAAYPWVKVLAQAQNVGFSEGNNIAIRQAKTPFILLLNPDTVVLDGAIGTMVGFLSSHPDVGVVGAKMYDGKMKAWRYDPWFPTARRYLFRHVRMWAKGDMGDMEVDWVCGACLLIRREVVDRIGPLDRFLFGEDIDWCIRAKQAGWKVFHLGSAKIIHYFGAAAGRTEVRAWRIFVTRESKLYYVQKHRGKGAAAMFGLALLLEAVVSIPVLLALVAFGPADRRRERWENVKGRVQVIASLVTGAAFPKASAMPGDRTPAGPVLKAGG